MSLKHIASQIAHCTFKANLYGFSQRMLRTVVHLPQSYNSQRPPQATVLRLLWVSGVKTRLYDIYVAEVENDSPVPPPLSSL